MSDDPHLETLRRVPYLSMLDGETLGEVAARGKEARFLPGERIVSELESGAELYVVLEGEAEVFVEPRAGRRQVLRTLRAGDAFGEMSCLTGELRSASVAALTGVKLLVIPDADFDRLRERRPEVAVALVKLLGERLAAAELAIDALLRSPEGDPEAQAKATGARVRRGSIARAWQELVVNRQRELTFLTLAAFMATLLVIRAGVFLSFRFEWAPRNVLRAAYLSGFALLTLSALTALLRFRPGIRRIVAVAYGTGCALILNELGVTLAFDIFFKDIHTPDPDVPFDIERLYRQTEPIRAIAIGLVILIQAAYLRRFYRRAAFVLRTRIRRLLARVRQALGSRAGAAPPDGAPPPPEG